MGKKILPQRSKLKPVKYEVQPCLSANMCHSNTIFLSLHLVCNTTTLVKKSTPRPTPGEYKSRRIIYEGSYMSAHVLLNLLNELGKEINCEACRASNLFFATI